MKEPKRIEKSPKESKSSKESRKFLEIPIDFKRFQNSNGSYQEIIVKAQAANSQKANNWKFWVPRRIKELEAPTLLECLKMDILWIIHLISILEQWNETCKNHQSLKHHNTKIFMMAAAVLSRKTNTWFACLSVLLMLMDKTRKTWQRVNSM